MANVLVVEGHTDAAFFQHLFDRLLFADSNLQFETEFGRENVPSGIQGTLRDGTSLEVEFRIAGGINNIPSAIETLLRNRVYEFTVALDVDDSTPERRLQSVREAIASQVSGPVQVESGEHRVVTFEGGRVPVLAMGLYQDPALDELGVSSYAREDYLVKLLLADTDLRPKCPDLAPLLNTILPEIRANDGGFSSSKELFQIMKPIVGDIYNDVGVVRAIFARADSGILRSVLAPLLTDVEQAFGVAPLS